MTGTKIIAFPTDRVAVEWQAWAYRPDTQLDELVGTVRAVCQSDAIEIAAKQFHVEIINTACYRLHGGWRP